MFDFLERLFNAKSLNREANIELLKIYAALNVISRHCIYFHYHGYEPKYQGLTFLQSLTTYCNGIFIIASGYFLSKSEFKISRMISIYVETLALSIIIFFDAVYHKKTELKWESAQPYFFPVLHSTFWYTGPFIFAQCLFCLICKGLKQINIFGHLCVFAIIYYTALASLCGYCVSIIDWGNGMNYNYFLLCLILGAIIRLNNIHIHINIALVFFVFFSFLHFIGISLGFRNYFSNSIVLKLLESDLMYAPLPVITLVFLFLFGQELKIPKPLSYVVNFLSDQCYAVYCWHHNPLCYWDIFARFPDREKKSGAFYGTIHHSLVIYFRSLLACIPIHLLLNFFIFNSFWFRKMLAIIDKFTTDTFNENPNPNQNQNDAKINEDDEIFKLVPVINAEQDEYYEEEQSGYEST